ncbi:hypothetical protein [Fuscibacter oryzae]|uniref:DUF2946 domain-containing protein n=1 Tax=Fuscibacter oryzae TaxID=2803939 RepID=A0A8J7MPT3_9RHOB|nr:hypothetical protein [Fuscibacter oryzae]MBL4928905.1 hypothetical protein [Fuscibacter oryzae]
MRHHPMIGLFLALCLALTSVSLAVARVQAPMAGWVEVCGTTGAMAVDADGRPVGPVHLCPDCIAAFAVADLHGAQPDAVPPQGWAHLAVGHLLPSQWAMPLLTVEARGPPPRF